METYLLCIAGFNNVYMDDITQVYLALRELGMKKSEIDIAIESLIRYDHNVLHVGFHKTFIFSERKRVA